MRSQYVKIKNELPELIEAVCNHPDCPDWLADGIWDAFDNQDRGVVFSAAYWRASLEMIAVSRTPEGRSPYRYDETDAQEVTNDHNN
jgi:hypothetical protein